MIGRRMRNSRLTGTPFDRPDDVVRWHLAMQAQDYGPAKWSIGQRSRDLVDEDLDRAVAAGSIVRTHVLRPTWHFVARDDIRWLLALTGPRVRRQTAPRYHELGLDGRTLARCERLIGSALGGGVRLTRKALGQILEDGGTDTSGQRLPHILMHLELDAVICSGGGGGAQHTYALLDERVPAAPPFDRDRALRELVLRYLSSHGPATVKDLRWWSSLTVADINEALSMLGSEVESETLEDLTFWSTASDAGESSGGRRVRLLHEFDELVVGYSESRYFGDPRAAQARAAWRDTTMPNGVILRGGRVVGHWRRRQGKGSIAIEAVTYDEPTPPLVRALETASRGLGRFTGRSVLIEVRRI